MNNVLVVMYHEISNKNRYLFDNTICTNIKNFEEHIKFYKENFEVIFIEEIYKKTNKPKLVITFDDGYKGNYENAFPLLKKYNLKATFFITTGFIDKSIKYWIFILKTIQKEKKVIDILWQINPILIPFLIKYDLKTIIKKFFKYDYIEKLNQFNLDKRLDKNIFLSWEDIKEMYKNELIKIGAHTISHPILSKLTFLEQKYEIEKSINKLEEMLNAKIDLFAYPFGKQCDFNDDTLNICKSFDLYTFTTISGNNKNFNKYNIKRIGIHNENINDLKNKLKGFL